MGLMLNYVPYQRVPILNMLSTEKKFLEIHSRTIHLNWLTGVRAENFQTFFLKASYDKTMSVDDSHLEFPISTRKVTFVEVHPMITHAMFALNWFTGFRGEIFQHFSIGSYVKTMSTHGGHLDFRSAQKTFRGPSNDHSCNVCFELVRWFQEKFFNIFP